MCFFAPHLMSRSECGTSRDVDWILASLSKLSSLPWASLLARHHFQLEPLWRGASHWFPVGSVDAARKNPDNQRWPFSSNHLRIGSSFPKETVPKKVAAEWGPTANVTDGLLFWIAASTRRMCGSSCSARIVSVSKYKLQNHLVRQLTAKPASYIGVPSYCEIGGAWLAS